MLHITRDMRQVIYIYELRGGVSRWRVLSTEPCPSILTVSLTQPIVTYLSQKLKKIAMASAFLGEQEKVQGERHQRARAGMALGQAIEELGVRWGDAALDTEHN